jgi:hypothetical protein
MPLSTSVVSAGGQVYGYPFVGPINHTDVVRVDVSGLTSDEVDSDGYLKPGVPLTAAGLLLTPADVVKGVVMEPVKVADGNAAGDLSGATDIDVALAVIGVVNRDIVEDNLGRALNADELAGFDLAGSHMTLTAT